MILTVVTPPAAEPVSLADAKLFLRVDIPDDDLLIGAIISAARIHAETITRRTFMATTFDLVIDQFPFGGGYYNRAVRDLGIGSPGWLPTNGGPLELPRPPLASVVSVTYLDGSNLPQVLDPARYRVITGTPGRILPAYGQVWPTTLPQVGAVTVRFLAGAADPATIDATALAAIRLMVGFLYENRSPDAAIPRAISALLASSDWGAYG